MKNRIGIVRKTKENRWHTVKFTDEQNNTIKRCLSEGVSFDQALKIANVDLSPLEDKGEDTPAVETPLHVDGKEDKDTDTGKMLLDMLNELTGSTSSKQDKPAVGTITCTYDKESQDILARLEGRPDILAEELVTAYKALITNDKLSAFERLQIAMNVALNMKNVTDSFIDSQDETVATI